MSAPPPTSFGEHLAALVVVGEGLQCRVHRMHTDIHQRRLYLFKDTDYERVRKSLDKHFPKRDQAAKEKGWEKFNESIRAQQISSELVAHYECVKECSRFRDIVLTALRRAPGTILRDPRGTIPVEEQFWPGSASRAFLDLLCIFARLHVQLERLGAEMRILVSAYNAAYFSQHGRDEEEFQSIAVGFTKMFEEAHNAGAGTPSHALRQLVDELIKSDESIVDLVSYLLEKVKPWFVSSTNKDHNVWQMETYACALPLDVGKTGQICNMSRCAQVCFRERARSWAIWGLLLCPGALASARTKFSEHARLETLFRQILSENIVETLYREQTIRLHDEFFDLFSNFPGKHQQACAAQVRERFDSFLTNKPKRLVNDYAVECANRGAIVHRERRVILAQLLHQALSQLCSNAAVMGPQFVAVLALLAASRDELIWYFAHHKSAAPKVHQTGVINTLFGGDSSKFVKEDWIDPVRVGVLLSMHTALFDKARQIWWIGEQYSRECLSGPLVNECKRRGLAEHAQALVQGTIFELQLLELRNETYVQPSTGSMYSTCSGFGDEFLPELFFHVAMLEDDGRGADPVALKRHAGLGELIFYPHLQEMFEESLKDQPRHCLAYFDLLSSAQDVLHPSCPEDFPLLGETVCAFADLFLQRVQAKLCEYLDELQRARQVLESQYGADRVVDRLVERKLQKQQASGFGASVVAAVITSNSSTAAASSTAASASAASLFGKDFKPGFESKPKYRDSTSELARAQRGVRGICASLGRETSNNTVLVWNRQYALREYLRETLVQWMDSKLRGALAWCRPTLLVSHFARTFDTVRFASEHGGFDAAVLIRQAWLRETSEEAGTTVDLARQTLIQFLETNFHLFVYSDFARAFLRFPSLDASGSSGDWFNAREMGALHSLLGARGVAALMRQFSSYVADLAARIKRLLLEDEPQLQDFKRALMSATTNVGTNEVMVTARATRHGEEIVQILRVLGGTIQCAKLLNGGSALDVQRVLLQGVEIAPMIWSLLPLAVSASLLVVGGGGSEFWKAADFLTKLDCHANNAHLVGTGVLALLQRTQAQQQLHAREMDFIRSFSLVLLAMKREQTTAEYRDYPLRGITLFLQGVVRESATLTPHALDEFLPSPILHAAVIDRNLGKVHGHEPGMTPEALSREIANQAMEEQHEEDAAAGAVRT